MEILVTVAALIWLGVLLVPWRPWRTREQLEPDREPVDLSDVTVLIPARNEAEVVSRTLAALANQGPGLRVVLVDDQSEDGTVEAARSAFPDRLTIVPGQGLPEGWSGKLWALEQGTTHVRTEVIRWLDADIELAPGMGGALRRKLTVEGIDM